MRLGLKKFFFTKPKQRFPRITIVYTVSIVNTCVLLALANVGGVFAAVPYGLFIVYDFPIPRAVYVAFMVAMSMGTGFHETILALSAFILETAISVIYIIGL